MSYSGTGIATKKLRSKGAYRIEVRVKVKKPV
jgi:hypothetical protein